MKKFKQIITVVALTIFMLNTLNVTAQKNKLNIKNIGGL
jgi:hypothetical protein